MLYKPLLLAAGFLTFFVVFIVCTRVELSITPQPRHAVNRAGRVAELVHKILDKYEQFESLLSVDPNKSNSVLKDMIGLLGEITKVDTSLLEITEKVTAALHNLSSATKGTTSHSDSSQRSKRVNESLARVEALLSDLAGL